MSFDSEIDFDEFFGTPGSSYRPTVLVQGSPTPSPPASPGLRCEEVLVSDDDEPMAAPAAVQPALMPAEVPDEAEDHSGKQTRVWLFTVNNFRPTDMDELGEAFRRKDSKCKFVMAEEVGANGTPHIQGAVEFSKRKRWDQGMPNWAKFGNRASVRMAKGTWLENLVYCTKEAGHKQFYNCAAPRASVPIVVISDEEMGEQKYVWMHRVIALVDGPIDPRKIIWVWDSLGGTGKSRLCKWLLVKKKDRGAIMSGGKQSDMLNAIKTYCEKSAEDKTIVEFPEIVICDVPMSAHEHFSYGGIEAIKNGCFYASKYEGGQFVFNAPHLIVFANFGPKYDEFGRDRFIEIDLN